MISKYRTRFSLIKSGKDSEEKQIFLVSTIEGNEVFYYSGFRVHPDNFIKEKVKLVNNTIYVQQVKKNTFNKAGDAASRINARLKELENASLLIFEREYKGKDIAFDKDHFKRELQIELGEYTEAPQNNSQLEKKDILAIHETFIEHLKKEDKYHRYHRTDNNIMLSYLSKEKNNEDPELFDVEKYYTYLLDGRAKNTVITLMKRVQRFFNWMVKEGYIKTSPFKNKRFSEEYGTEIYSEPICMTREELTQLYTHEYNNAHKNLVRDMFCLQASLGCRVGDYMRLTHRNIQNNVLTYYPQKTKEQLNKVVVPLSSRAIEILTRYKGKSKGNLIMPFVNSVQYNETLKAIFKEAGLDRIVIWYNRDKRKEESAHLHELASSHLARRTFVDILCQAGEPIHVVASMSGHSENSKAFDRYRRRPEQLQIKAVSRSMD